VVGEGGGRLWKLAGSRWVGRIRKVELNKSLLQQEVQGISDRKMALKKRARRGAESDKTMGC
jgi:hypothetical protein